MAGPVRKKHGTKQERAWQGPALFSLGFRPFFLFASLYASLAMLWWLAVLHGIWSPDHPLSAYDWHRHEMLWGYSSAVIAGFLFTAVPNRSGHYPISGWPLIAVFCLWATGRLAVLGGVFLPFKLVAGLDVVFLPVQASLVAREVLAAKNTHNFKVLAPVILLAGSNIWFYIDIWYGNTGDGPVRMGFGAILMLLVLIGGRVIPSFTRNWLVQQGARTLPAALSPYDKLVSVVTNFGLVAWVFAAPYREGVAILLAVIGGLHLLRLGRWAGVQCWRNPLLAMLHVFYGAIGIGFLVLAVAVWRGEAAVQTAALHIFGMGAIGGLTITVMMRSSLSQTGRQTQMGPIPGLAVGLVLVAVILRILAIFWSDGVGFLTASGVFWIAGFGLFTAHVGPWLMQPRAKM